MPNWCSTDITIKASKESIDKLYEEMEIAFSGNPLKADFGNRWLGNLLLHIGREKEDILHGGPRCRGEVCFFDKDENEITMATESAWTPHVKCIKEFCDHYVDDAKIYYHAEEPGCEVYLTNDPEKKGTVYVDVYGLDSELEERLYYCFGLPTEQATKYLSEYLGCEPDLDVIRETIYEKAGDNSYVCIEEYEFVDVDDLD